MNHRYKQSSSSEAAWQFTVERKLICERLAISLPQNPLFPRAVIIHLQSPTLASADDDDDDDYDDDNDDGGGDVNNSTFHKKQLCQGQCTCITNCCTPLPSNDLPSSISLKTLFVNKDH